MSPWHAACGRHLITVRPRRTGHLTVPVMTMTGPQPVARWPRPGRSAGPGFTMAHRPEQAIPKSRARDSTKEETMPDQYELPRKEQHVINAKCKALRAFFRLYPHLEDSVIIATMRKLAGENHYPQGQDFLEKGMIVLKKAMKTANPLARQRLVENLILNECVKGQAMRRHVTEQVGVEIPVLLVVSPTMRCPLNCYGCYAAQYSKDADLDFKAFDNLITEAKSIGIHFFVISGGEPFIYPGIHEIFAKHSDVWFQVYTSGVTLTDDGVSKLAGLGNVMPCISVEGFKEEVDQRRGEGHFDRITAAFARLRNAGVPFGFSATATRQNNDLVMSDEFVEFYMKQGASVGWYFQYLPIGREPNFELAPTAEQRIARLKRIGELRQKYPLALADFWNDGPTVGGCIAVRRYLHINHAGRIEPCVFCQFSTESIYEMGLLDALRKSPLFAAVRKRQPYNENLLRPCMIIDNPQVLKEIVDEAMPAETCPQGAKRLIGERYTQLCESAAEFGVLADDIWRRLYAVDYREALAEARRLQQAYQGVRQTDQPQRATTAEPAEAGEEAQEPVA
ncbi:MAG: radical SAM protein [Chitinivibrionales bacterium]|nr:radical SAM protein [Chitinivibrionales bacterium]